MDAIRKAPPMGYSIDGRRLWPLVHGPRYQQKLGTGRAVSWKLFEFRGWAWYQVDEGIGTRAPEPETLVSRRPPPGVIVARPSPDHGALDTVATAADARRRAGNCCDVTTYDAGIAWTRVDERLLCAADRPG
jgi:hypothetical protein